MEIFVKFDDESWKLNYKLSRSLSREMHTAKDKIRATFEKYFALSKDARTGETWLVGILEIEMRKIGLEEHDIAALFGMPFWVYVSHSLVQIMQFISQYDQSILTRRNSINSNANKLCFWIMAYLLYDPALYAFIRAEVDQAVS